MPEETQEASTIDKKDVKMGLASYTFRVKECTKEVSKSSGNQMLKVISELVDEPPVIIDGESVDVNGLEPKPKYISPLLEKDGNGFVPTKKCKTAVNEFRRSCGMDEVDLNDLANIEPAHFVGRKFTALANTKTDVMKDRETGREVINKLTGKPILTSSFEIGRILTA